MEDEVTFLFFFLSPLADEHKVHGPFRQMEGVGGWGVTKPREKSSSNNKKKAHP